MAYETTAKPKFVTCKKCDIRFKGMSDLRKHQWAEHLGQFKNLMISSNTPRAIKKIKKAKAGGWSVAQRAKFEATLALKKAQSGELIRVGPPVVKASTQSNGGELTVTQLLDKLKDQQRFLQDVVFMITGMVNQHSEVSK